MFCCPHTRPKNNLGVGYVYPMFRASFQKKMNNLPADAKVLPWFIVFLILFACISAISAVMTFIESRNSGTQQQSASGLQFNSVPLTFDNPTTGPPRLLPELVERRYDIPMDKDHRPLPYLYTWSRQTRQVPDN